MSNCFSGRRILVSGGAKGIGHACVARFLEGGGRVTCLDVDADAVAALGGASGLTAIVADVTDTDAVERAVAQAAEAMGGLDGLVNAAGIDLVAAIDTMTDAQWDRLLSVNLTGPMKLCRAAVPHLRRAGGGTIVNISSGAGLQPLRHRSAYSASKAGLQMLSKSLALELAESGIRVNAICPGAVETPLFRSSLDTQEDETAQLAAVRARYALGRIATADEIAAAVAWLTGAQSSYVTGVALAVDGGRTFH